LIRNESDIPIIMFSGVNERDDVVLAIKRGASDYVLKDTGFRELLNRVSMHARKRAADLLTTAPRRRTPGQVLPFTSPPALVPEVAGLVGPRANAPKPPVDLSGFNVKTVRVEPAATHQGASGNLLEELVIVAHSDPESLKQLASIAGRTRLEVAKAMTGQEAIEILATRSPRLIVVGNILTEMNCISVIEAVQNHRLGELMGTILAIGKRAPELTRRARYMGVSDIIFKPWDDGRLDLAIRTALNTTRQAGAGLRAA
jgi:DNA-binding response OmpR family regulator